MRSRGLRQDIADELADHLQSAALRESITHSDPQEVERRVLRRFGNPKKIARQLWFDAMQEKLMMQKLTLALVTLAAIASATACGVMLTFGMKANEELLKQNRQMMEQLTALVNREPEGPNLMEWVPLSVQLKQQNEKQSPAAGFKIKLYGHAISTSEETMLQEQPDKAGLAKFGLVRPGTYTIALAAPWGQKLRKEIVVKPGAAHTEIVNCPAGLPQPEQLKPVVKWPKELKDQDVALIAKVSLSCETTIDENVWTEIKQYYLLIRPDGRLAKYADGIQTLSRFEPFTPERKRILEEEVFLFRSDPEVFQDSFPVQGQFLTFYELEVVKLPRDADFPGNGDSLFIASQSRHISNSNPFQRRTGSEAQTRVSLANPGGSQEVSIELDPADVAMTQAKLAMEQFPQFLASNVGHVALMFFRFDKDRNMELSEEEATKGNVTLPERFDQFPVSLKTFIQTSLEPPKK